MKWIITGGAGFIGKNLAIKLLLEDQHVVVVDKLSFEDSGYEQLLEGELSGLGIVNLKYLQRDMTKPQDLDFLYWFSPDGGDVVIHLAAMSGVKDCSAVPLSAFYINLEATFSLLDGAADFNVRRFVFASSGAVVAGHGGCPSEVVSPQPVNVYGAMKAAVEQLCKGFYHERGLSTASMRFSNVYGPHSQHKGSAVHKFVRGALACESLEVHGAGTQKRDFVYVADVVDALVAAGLMTKQGAHVFHVSSGKAIAIFDRDGGNSLYDLICNSLNVDEVPFNLVEEDPGVSSASLDSTVSRRILMIGEATPIIDGLRTMVSWYRKLGESVPGQDVRDAIKQHRVLDDLGVEEIGEKLGCKSSFNDLPASGSQPSESPVLPAEVVSSPVGQEPRPRQSETAHPDLQIYFGDNLSILRTLPSASYDLIYIDPPFNTGKEQIRTRIRTVRDQEGGDRTGFQGNRYRTIKVGTASFADDFEDFFEFMEPRLEEARRLLKIDGTFLLHIDYREVHYCKVWLDNIFGRDAFINEIIWAYDYGGRSKRKWSAKHDNILWYVRDTKKYTFNFDEMDRIPYMAPGLVGKEKAARGKTPTDVWWHTIVPTNGRERTGYPTQKPLGIMNRILKVHTRAGDRVLDFFAGSGTTGEAALRLDRSCTLIDNNVEAMAVMAKRLSFANPDFHDWLGDPERPCPTVEP